MNSVHFNCATPSASAAGIHEEHIPQTTAIPETVNTVALETVFANQATTCTPESKVSCFRKNWSYIKGLPHVAKMMVKGLKKELLPLYLCCKDIRCPLAPKLIVIAILTYLASPIDLIPDFIPVLGYLDDVVIAALGILLAKKLIPQALLEEMKEKVQKGEKIPKNKIGALFVLLIWGASAMWAGKKALHWLHRKECTSKNRY